MRALFQILIGVATHSTVASRMTHEPRPARRARARDRTAGGDRSSGRRAPGGGARGRSARAAARPASRPCSDRSICQARRGRLVKTNGEKCQIASFGHSSRRPPPAKPQPMAKGSAIHSPAKSGGMPTMRADGGAGVRAVDQAREKGALQRQIGGVVAAAAAARRRRPRAECRGSARRSAGRARRAVRRSECAGTGGIAPASSPAPP